MAGDTVLVFDDGAYSLRIPSSTSSKNLDTTIKQMIASTFVSENETSGCSHIKISKTKHFHQQLNLQQHEHQSR